MRQAFTLLGVMTIIVAFGAFLAFEKVEAPVAEDNVKTPQLSMSLILSSPAFEDGGVIPAKYTCDGDNISPELHIENIPEGTKSFLLVMDDPDIPDSVKEARNIEKFDHWALYNIPADTTVIPEGQTIGTRAQTSLGMGGYIGPCPPDKEHRYIFRVYALSEKLSFAEAPTLDEVEARANEMTIDSAVLIGRYKRK